MADRIKRQNIKQTVLAVLDELQAKMGGQATAHSVFTAMGTGGTMPRPFTHEELLEVLRDLHRDGRIKIVSGRWNAPLTKIFLATVGQEQSGAGVIKGVDPNGD